MVQVSPCRPCCRHGSPPATESLCATRDFPLSADFVVKVFLELVCESGCRIRLLPGPVGEQRFLREPSIPHAILSAIRSIRRQSGFCNKICREETHAAQQALLGFARSFLFSSHCSIRLHGRGGVSDPWSFPFADTTAKSRLNRATAGSVFAILRPNLRSLPFAPTLLLIKMPNQIDPAARHRFLRALALFAEPFPIKMVRAFGAHCQKLVFRPR
jgi:hypothetical protein